MTLDVPMPSLVFFAVAAVFACYRVVRLWQTDTITEPLRTRVYRWCGVEIVEDGDGDEHVVIVGDPSTFRLWLFALLSCQWCLGVWVAAAATAALIGSGVWPLTGPAPARVVTAGIVWLAFAAAQSFVHLVEQRLNDD